MWPNPQFPEDLVTFTEEILYGKLHILCREWVTPVAAFTITSVYSNMNFKADDEVEVEREVNYRYVRVIVK